MLFSQVLEALKNGCPVKREHWTGFWKKDGDTVIMHCRGGVDLDIRETEDTFFTLQNIAADDWVMCGEGFQPGVPLPVTMSFGEALRMAKKGNLIARKGWNGDGMAVAYQPGYPEGIPSNAQTAKTWNINVGDIFKCRPYLQLRCADGTYQMWTASQSDVLAEDWYITD